MSGKPPPKELAQGRFKVEKKLGSGCFGDVYLGTDTKADTKVAIKLEEASSNSCLATEVQMLDTLRRPYQMQGFAEVFWFNREGGFNCMIMELLSRSLEDCVEVMGGKLDVRATTLIAEQVILRIEYLHSKGILHRDIKPENFMWGSDRKIHHLYIIDFGLSQRYYDRKHVALKTDNALEGTARYASINAHKGCTQSRRDDLEAIGHMLFYFLLGALPWSGLKARDEEEKFRKIAEKKASTPLEELGRNFPQEFQDYLRYCRDLTFKEQPDYGMLKMMFKGLRDREGPPQGQEHELPWLKGQKIEAKNLIPLDTAKSVHQPDENDAKSKGTGGSTRGLACLSFGRNKSKGNGSAKAEVAAPLKAPSPKAPIDRE